MACKESWIEKNYYSPIRTFVPKPKQIISEPKRYISQPTTYSSQTKTYTSSDSDRYSYYEKDEPNCYKKYFTCKHICCYFCTCICLSIITFFIYILSV